MHWFDSQSQSLLKSAPVPRKPSSSATTAAARRGRGRRRRRRKTTLAPMRQLAAALPPGTNLFSSPSPKPRINEPLRRNVPPPPRPLPRKKAPSPPPPPPSPLPPGPARSPALKATHSRTKYYKPVPPGGGVIAADGHDRRVVVGESGVSYLLPGAPFEFQFSYSESPRAKPLAIREPAFLPFGPPTMPRPWTGKAPLKSKKEKELKRQRRVRLLDPLGGGEQGDGVAAAAHEGGGGKVMEMAKPVPGLVQYSTDGRSREEILGKPLTRVEVKAMVKPHLSHNRQVNLGRDGLTHNMLELIHTHWRRQEVCKIRCRGVPTVDMNNVCRHLEEKTGGKIIYRIGGVIYLFRGRNYNPRTRPRFPTMLWKPATPVYPKLIQEAPEGLTRAEADGLRKKGENLLPICNLAKNGIYINLVRNVRDAFEESPLVKINCQGLPASDYKKIGAKLKELVPCVLLSFDQEQILMWRGNDWQSRYTESSSSVRNNRSLRPGQSNGIDAGSTNKTGISTPKMLSLWRCAIESKKALLLDEMALSPDSLLEKVEEFEGTSQATEHSYPALISQEESKARPSDGEPNVVNAAGHCADDVGDSLEFLESSIPFGSLPVDLLAKHLNPE